MSPIFSQRLLDATLNKRDALLRQQEILHDISFELGFRWAGMSVDVQERILDHVGGSRELSDMAASWAEEFDKWWEKNVDDQCRVMNADYIDAIDDFATRKVDELIKAVVVERLTT